jgi:hypothetical protein
MLVPLIIELLITSLLMLVVGWASDVLHASMNRDRSYLDVSIERLQPPGLRQRRCHDSAT